MASLGDSEPIEAAGAGGEGVGEGKVGDARAVGGRGGDGGPWIGETEIV